MIWFNESKDQLIIKVMMYCLIKRIVPVVILILVFILNISFNCFKDELSTAVNHTVNFQFELKRNGSTSAGVFRRDGELVRSLWSGVDYKVGRHSASWDGLDDYGKLSEKGHYVIKVLSSDLKYVWDGVLGNTSKHNEGADLFRAINVIQGIAIAGENVYYSTGYNEQSGSTFKFDEASPGRTAAILGKGIAVHVVATDSTLVYWGGREPGRSSKQFIYATTVRDDSEFMFKSGSPAKTLFGRVYRSVIDYSNDANDSISAIAVQKYGAYLFVAHRNLNLIRVLNKTNGNWIRDIKITSPSGLGVDGKKEIWISYKNGAAYQIQKFKVNDVGFFIPENIVLKNLDKPLAFAVSTEKKLILVADAGASQQIKGFDTATGRLKWQFGQYGGYSQDPTVRDDKFYFSDLRKTMGTAMAIDHRGNFWVEDKGNYRLQEYSIDRVFINRVMYLPTCYSIGMDFNNSKRVFADYLEFEVDENKPLLANNGSWKLVRNWGNNVPFNEDNKYGRLKNVATLKNRRTYAFIAGGDSAKSRLVELPPEGPLRLTNVWVSKEWQLYPDGSLRKRSRLKVGYPYQWTKIELLGFDESYNPLWQNVGTVITTPPATKDDPLSWGSPSSKRAAEITSSGMLVSFDEGHYPHGSARWHLGGFDIKSNRWLWRTAMGTPLSYKGEFPRNGAYDNGNSVHNAGSLVIVSGRMIFWGYCGEGWKGGEVNKWNIVHDDGLFMGQFGITGREVKDKIAPAGLAGNAISASVTGEKNGSIFLYHNDESIHSGIHRWKISNLTSVQELIVPVTLDYNSNGLFEEQFLGTDFNNLKIVSQKVIKDLTTKNPVNKDHTVSDRSIRLSGFVNVPQAGEYYFKVRGATNARIWVNNVLCYDTDRQPISKIEMIPNVNYSINVEYIASSSNDLFSLMWAKDGSIPNNIPTNFLIPRDPIISRDSIDLLENISFNEIKNNPLYGWSYSPKDMDSTNKLNKWWMLTTNVQQYNKDRSTDISVVYRQKNGSACVSRDLGDLRGQKINFWKITGIVNYDGCSPNSENGQGEQGSGGSSIELLSSNGTKIVEMFFQVSYQQDLIKFLVNGKILFVKPRAAAYKILQHSNPFSIEYRSDGIKVKYCENFVLLHWNRYVSTTSTPKTFKLNFWSNDNTGRRAIDIEKLALIKR